MKSDKEKQDFVATSSIFDDKKKDRWDEIKFKIKIDPTLDQVNVEQLYGNCWINFQMFLLGLKSSLNVASLEDILWIHKGFCCVGLL